MVGMRTIRSGKICAARVAYWAILVCCLSGLLLIDEVRAQDTKDRIEDVVVVGNRRIRESTIFYYIQTPVSYTHLTLPTILRV